MKKIFISYSSKDREFAYNLVEYLEDNGVQCFIAPRDIDGGKPYASALMDAIYNCAAVMLIASKSINESEHVLNEVDVVFAKKKTILPVFVEDFELSDDYRYYLGRKHWIIAYPDPPQTYFQKILDTVSKYLPGEAPAVEAVPEKAEPLDLSKTTVFDYYPDRGIMVNPEDHQRNVSFRTDTIVNMMGGIFERVEEIAGSEAAESIFFDSGYASGKNFSEKINNQWDTGYSFEDIKNKINKWCEFDSAVGWGLFSSEIFIDEENDSLTGKIRINEPFIVDHKKKRKICAFIRGYSSGVVENLLNSIEVELTCSECPLKSRFKTQCVFELKTK